MAKVNHTMKSSVWHIRQHSTDVAKVQSFYELFGANDDSSGKPSVWAWTDKDIAVVSGIVSTPGKEDYQRVYTARKTLLDRGVLEKVSNGRVYSYRVVMPPCDDAALEVLNRHASFGGEVHWSHPQHLMQDLRSKGMPFVLWTGWETDFPDLLDVEDDDVIQQWRELTEAVNGNIGFRASKIPGRWKVQALLELASHRLSEQPTSLTNPMGYIFKRVLAPIQRKQDPNFQEFADDIVENFVPKWEAMWRAGHGRMSFGAERVEKEKPVQKIPESVKASTLVKAAKAAKDARVKYHEPEVVPDEALSAMIEPLSLLDEMNSAWEDR